MSWPITDQDVIGYLGVAPAGEADQAAMGRAAAAAVAWVTSAGVAPPAPALGDPAVSAPEVELGTIMLAARWYARRTSTQGIASFGDLGVSYVIRHDPDVAQLLGLGRPMVG